MTTSATPAVAQAPKKPLPLVSIFEWGSIILLVALCAGGGFVLFPLFQSFQSLPERIAALHSDFQQQAVLYQATSKNLEAYREALSTYPQELRVLPRVFWKNAAEPALKAALEDKGRSFGVAVDRVSLRQDIAASFPGMVTFDADITGGAEAMADFKRSLTDELPLVWIIAFSHAHDKIYRLTAAVFSESALESTNVPADLTNDLYSYSKFRILTESSEAGE